MKAFAYYFGLVTSYLINLVFFKTKVFYEDNTKQNRFLRGKAIVIANHRSPLDCFVIAYKYCMRRINYVVANFFKGKKRILMPLVRFTGGVIVDRDIFSFNFFEKCKKLLNNGKLVLIFPEGHFIFDYEPRRFVHSYLELALQSRAPIIPIVSDFNYGFFKRTHILVGNRIDLSSYELSEKLTKERLKEINEEIYQHIVRLYYLLKKKKYDKYCGKYGFAPPQPGDIVRVSMQTHYHYGVFLSNEEVVQFGHRVNRADEEAVVNAVSLHDFCGGEHPEVRLLSRREKRHRMKTEDIMEYARLCLGQGGYSLSGNNCRDFAIRVVFA